MAETLQILFKISMVLFMAGNLLDMGLRLELQEALAGLRNVRFVVLILLWGFVLCPALAYLLTRVIPMDPGYGIGLILLAMAPGAPYLPMVVDKSRGDLGYAAATMLMTAVGTVVFMPIAVPLLTTGLTASAWTIAKPLLFFILIPFAIGIAVHFAWEPVSAKLHPFVKTTTTIATLVLVVVVFAIYGKQFISAVGSYEIAAQIVFLAVVTTASYRLRLGLAPNQKSVLVLGLVSRNIGAAAAPLLAVSGVDQRSLIMVTLALPITVLWSFLVAIWFGRRASMIAAAAKQTTSQVNGSA